jgi:uncharacterized protein (DUF1778 family)
MALEPRWVYPGSMKDDESVMYLTAAEWEQLQEALAAPAKPIPALVELFRRYGKKWAD